MGLIPFLSPISIVKQIDHGLGNMSLVSPDKFQHILRVQNTNIDGTRNIMFAMTAIRGIGRRFSNLICKKADIDLSKRAGQLDDDEIRRMETIMLNPRQYKIPDWFLNRQKDWKDGTLASLSPTVSTPSSVRIWSVSRRSVPTVVSAITGSSVSVVSIPRPLVAVAAPSVSPRRSRQYDELFTVHDQEVNCVSLCTQKYMVLRLLLKKKI